MIIRRYCIFIHFGYCIFKALKWLFDRYSSMFYINTLDTHQPKLWNDDAGYLPTFYIYIFAIALEPLQ